MKTSTILVALFLSGSLISTLNAQKTVEKTLVKSFNLQGNDVVDLELTGDIEVKEWSSPSIRVEMLISMDNGNETMLKSLIKAGRYNLVSNETETAFKVTMPGLEREIKVKGALLRDKVSYIVNIPSGVSVRNESIVEADID